MFFNKAALTSIADVDRAATQLSQVWDQLFPPAPKFDGKKKNILREMVCKLAGFDGGYQQFLAFIENSPEDTISRIRKNLSLIMRASFSNAPFIDSEGATLPLEVAGFGTIYLQTYIERFNNLIENSQPANISLEGFPIVVIHTGRGYETISCANQYPIIKLERLDRIVQRAAALGLKISDFYQSNLINQKFLTDLIFDSIDDNSMLNNLAAKLKVSPTWIING
ncbi:hypothetical protein OCF84_21145 (plasmid) [Shewanella xiamenensis]|uniref:Uncharacterized protein n=1 Tax=Shewanella xiamenensis TaxID=332186 RepID=A0ABT6UDS2_9GAMM|nr:hypothetical protein [Shewanella xiamenensis]MDI5832618.1 hypothetical protein [Shewanella xiamenensis]WHF57765.1 hypothetical protein OCF84_21145 [Shewanella xiamenensis]